MVNFKLNKAKPQYIKADTTLFKYYIGLELDRVRDEYKEKYGENEMVEKALDEAYFKIIERFEPYFKDIEL